MSRLALVTESELPVSTLDALSPFRMGGKLAPVYNQIANSDAALNAYLTMENALKQSSLSLQEIEAIKLLVSELNQCEHCLAVHHMKSTAAGLDDETKLRIRMGKSVNDMRLSAIVKTIFHFIRLPGVLTDEHVAHLREVGLTDAELVDMSLVAATIFFTNIFNHINDTRTSLPAPPRLNTRLDSELET